MPVRAAAVTLLLILAGLLGCDSKRPPPVAAPPTTVATTHAVTAATGGVAGGAADAQVTVPPGAVPRDVTIALTKKAPEARATPQVRLLGPVWEFRVDGAEHFAFSKPVRISVPFDPDLRLAKSEPVLSVWDGERWQKVPGARVDAAARRIVADVDHFSEYAASEEAPRDLEHDRKQFLNNEYWYGTVVVDIRGKGRRYGDGSQESYFIKHHAKIQFRVHVDAGELSQASQMEKIKNVPLPPTAGQTGKEVGEKFALLMEQLKNRRHWNTEVRKPEADDETNLELTLDASHNKNSEEFVLGEAQEKATYAKYELKGGQPGKFGPKAGKNALEIDVAARNYSFSVGPFVSGTVIHTEEKKDEDGIIQKPPPETKPARVKIQIDGEQLPDSGSVIAGRKKIRKADLRSVIGEIPDHWKFDFGSVRGQIRWMFSPKPLEDVELVLAPERYDDWLPEGGKDEHTPGKTPLPVKATLRRPGGGSTGAKMTKFVANLEDVSNEPGVCLNRPLEKGAETPDLKFKEGAGFKIESDGSKLLKEGGEFTEVPMTIDCYDWGAWGTLTAHAWLADGRLVWATLDTDPSIEEVLIPKREEGSKIADKWKSDMKASGGDLDDADPQKGNRNDGDGLTLYEEYRGMFAKKKHTRDYKPGRNGDGWPPLSPRRKDLIVLNTVEGEPAVISGFRLLEKAAGIHVVEVDNEDLPASLEVNVNRGKSTSNGAQHGLKVFDVPTLGNGVTGETPPDGNLPGRGKYPRVQVSLTEIRRSNRIGWTLAEEIANTVAHELAHGLDVGHHGPSNRVNLADPSRLAIYDMDRKRVQRTIKEPVGMGPNESSGDVNCIMCYTTMYIWAYIGGSFLFAVDITPPGRSFCTSKAGTGFNSPFEIDDPQRPGRKLQIKGMFGNADSRGGNCLGQMKVKDQ